MLIELAIQDLALIERAGLEFGPGLNVITGETGAGKSLLVDALELLLGGRAKASRGQASLVRKGAERARVEGRFVLPADGYSDLVKAWLGEHLPEALEEISEPVAPAAVDGAGAHPEGELELILTRTIARDGRSRAHVNHRPVTQRSMRELSSMLVEIHGQHDHQRLFEPVEQLRLIDAFGGLEGVLEGYRELRQRWLQLALRIEQLETGEAERLQRLDLLRFQVGELADAEPSVQGYQALLAERDTLRHGEKLREELGGLAFRLADADDAALDLVRQAERAVSRWAERIEDLSGPARELSEAGAHLEEAAVSLARFLEGIDLDPTRLDAVEEQLDVLERLQRKHRTDMAGLVARSEELRRELEQLEGAEEGRGELQAKLDLAREALEESGRRLGKARRALTTRLVRQVEAGLGQLGLERASFSIEYRSNATEDEAGAEPDADRDSQPIAGRGRESAAHPSERRRFGPNGLERVEFLLAANPGEDCRPLRSVASGGEAARIMLALRGALAVKRSTPTLVFDEVDAGVGGRLGPRVGEHLRNLGEHHQVLCVTHLPAIAAGANHHIRVCKAVKKGRTRTEITPLLGEARVEEIAAMIAGAGEAETARAEARRLLGQS